MEGGAPPRSFATHMTDHRYGLLIGGGAGTRLWPLSRRHRPKQLLPLGGGETSLLQAAFGRLTRTVSPERVFTVTSRLYDEAVHAQLAALAPEYPRTHVLAEPTLRDSAPAVLWGALCIHLRDPEAVMAVLWTDQLIRNEPAFDAALSKALGAVEEEGLALVGVPAIRPSTTLGYIKLGPDLGNGVYEAERFVEKPERAEAERLVADGGYLWNPGIFAFKVRTLLEEYERLAPDLIGHFREHAQPQHHPDWCDRHAIEAIYARLPREAIDTLILERTHRLRLVPTDLDWSDLGTWDELYFQADKDEQGNALQGDVVTLDTRNIYVRGGKRLVAAVGVEGLVVIDTDDALLVCDLSRVQDVKHLVDQLSRRGRSEAERGPDDEGT